MKKVIIALFAVITALMCAVGASAKTVLLGDIDSNGKITASDARIALRASAGLEELTEEQLFIADIDGSGKVNASDARTILRCAAGLEKSSDAQYSEIHYLNELMDDNDELELFAATCGELKQDGFVFKYKHQLLIHDGGNKGTDDGTVYKYLCDLRKSLLPEGVDETDENYKLKLTLVISHFHTDHVNTLTHDIIPSPYFEIEEVYMPEQSVFENTSYFSDAEICDPFYYADGVITKKGRLAFLDSLEKYSPDTNVVCLGFGETMQLESADGKVIFDLFAPSEDWGTEENAKKILDLYYEGGAAEGTAKGFPTNVVNANSLWLKVTYGDRTMLFTGDVIKKSVFAYKPSSAKYVGEPFDLMLSYYAEKCGEDVFDVDMVKFPHHGKVRPRASKGVFEVFTPELVLCTAPDFRETTIEKAQKFWDAYTGSYCVSDGTGLYIRTDGTNLTVSKELADGVRNIEIFDSDGNLSGATGEILTR